MSYVSSKVKSENDIKTPSTLKYMNCFIFDLNNQLLKMVHKLNFA